MTYHVIYNPLAGGGTCTAKARGLRTMLAPNECLFYDITDIKNYHDFFAGIPSEDPIILCGGDGTLNRFINDAVQAHFTNPLYYYATGSGNDFLRDIDVPNPNAPVQINAYLQSLPSVYVNGEQHYFLNGIGYGIDGYCCEVGDELREKESKPVNYTAIAVKGLLFHYKPTNAVITVDGREHRYDHVWLAPTMNGRFYGGGMMPTPKQDRLSTDSTVSVMVYHSRGKLRPLCVFPSIFKGEHVRHTKMVDILTGYDIKVQFDRPTPLQIDGETIRNVKSYQVVSAKRNAATQESVCTTI